MPVRPGRSVAEDAATFNRRAVVPLAARRAASPMPSVDSVAVAHGLPQAAPLPHPHHRQPSVWPGAAPLASTLKPPPPLQPRRSRTACDVGGARRRTAWRWRQPTRAAWVRRQAEVGSYTGLGHSWAAGTGQDVRGHAIFSGRAEGAGPATDGIPCRGLVAGIEPDLARLASIRVRRVRTSFNRTAVSCAST